MTKPIDPIKFQFFKEDMECDIANMEKQAQREIERVIRELQDISKQVVQDEPTTMRILPKVSDLNEILINLKMLKDIAKQVKRI